MSKVNEFDYRYEVCPHCGSKKLSPVGVVRMNSGQYNADIDFISRTGYLCGNCQRYTVSHRTKYIYDRKEIRRDIKKLQEFLEK